MRICLHRVLAWTEGWAGELAAVVGVADLWRRGCGLRGLCDRFPFMSWSGLAQAFEDGDPAPARWRQLLADDRHAIDFRRVVPSLNEALGVAAACFRSSAQS